MRDCLWKNFLANSKNTAFDILLIFISSLYTQSRMNNKILLSEIYSELLSDFDLEDSEFRGFIESLIFNTILNNLEHEQRIELVKLLESGEKAATLNFLHKNIPDLEDLLVEKLRIEMKIFEEIGQFSK